MIQNPILPGFHPDPSIVRVGEDYFLATSTFEWFPGVALYHSRDLAHWSSLGGALTRPSQLNLSGVPDSGGIWAPSLSFHDDKFWLVYTVMRTRTGPYKDMVNLLVTADRITGPWSEPVYLNSRGFDPSLFHDEDGRKWLVQILWDHRRARPSFAGIVVQEWDAEKQLLVGKAEKIFEKSCLIEGPNIYRRNGYYYLLLAQGGTSWEHAVSMARSRNLLGPYEADPQEVVLSSRGAPELPLQKAGHGELVDTPDGESYLVHLASRPVLTSAGPRCPLGRETCLQKVLWTEDGWLRLSAGGTLPQMVVPTPRSSLRLEEAVPREARAFQPAGLGLEWMTLRGALHTRWADLQIRPGWLRLRGRESPASLHDQSLVAQRVISLSFRAQVRLDFRPGSFSQMAGLVCFYDTKTHFYLRVTAGDRGERLLGIVAMQDGRYEELGDVEIASTGEIVLCVDWQESVLRFSYALEGGVRHFVGPPLDASVLSDDFGAGLHFTGAFVGLCVQDLDCHAGTADFADFILTSPCPRQPHAMA